ncbi:MAG: cyclic pyranopterin phosphate synthase [Chloroflexi bacterium]|jgi:cyclic pyranopterin phosphate synthase|nr:MAG: cyclic pyranopterin phosphate synthase [Chloroflexota bacterium]
MAGKVDKFIGLSHVDEEGRGQMVDLTDKKTTLRDAVAVGSVYMKPETLFLIRERGIEKGDVLAIARVAGIMAAKQTFNLIPFCHNIPLSHVSIEFSLDDARSAVEVTAFASTNANTGVEMEALTAVTLAALTIYDMAKAVDREMKIGDVRLISKRGGQSGDFHSDS